MGRNSANPNVDTPQGRAKHDRKSEWSGPEEEQEREDTREEHRGTAEALDEVLTMREADARREVPRLRTDSANPRKDRRLPAPSAVRGMLSSNMKKELNSSKTAWVRNLPKTRRRAMENTMRDRDSLEGVIRGLNSTVGAKSELPSGVRKRVEAIDRANSDYEVKNEREHIVYSTLKAPYDHGNSRNALRRKLAEMSADPDRPSLTFDSYIPASHSLGNVADSPDIVMEIRTRSGSYLGTSDSTPNGDHLVGRGRVLRPVGVHEVSYIKPDGSRGQRWIVQMDDITPDGRTTART